MQVHKRRDRWHYAFCILGVRYREAMPVDSRYKFLLVLTFLGVAFLLFPNTVAAVYVRRSPPCFRHTMIPTS
jgi:hypothetical protein